MPPPLINRASIFNDAQSSIRSATSSAKRIPLVEIESARSAASTAYRRRPPGPERPDSGPRSATPRNHREKRPAGDHRLYAMRTDAGGCDETASSCLHCLRSCAGALGGPSRAFTAGERHFLYVAEPGIRNYVEYGGVGVLVFDMDDGYAFVRRIPTSEVAAGDASRRTSRASRRAPRPAAST